MEKSGTASQVAEDEERLFDGLVFICGEENIIELEKEPVEECCDWPDYIEQCQKYDPFSSEAGGSVF